ncbi:MAG TPA: MgtC/SapB family protein [archaeon]|nr:MgtC/SapB family protein [archaeon]
MENFELTFQFRFLIALGLGFLLGLERETSGIYRKRMVIAGVRTHSLVSLFGFGCAWLSQIGVAFALPIGLLSIIALSSLEYIARMKEGHHGWTSEVALLLTFIIGALTLLTKIWVPLALGIISAILLSEKTLIEHYVQSLQKFELFAILKFLVVTLLVLPLLPDKGYTQFNLNPVSTWKIVIIISSIGFAGYFMIKKLGSRYGLWLSGVLGGIVSSTAVSIAMGRIAQQAPEMSKRALRSSLLASSVMYIRILVIIWIIGPQFLPFIWWKLLTLAGFGLIFSLYFRTRIPISRGSDFTTLKNPFEITPAMIFAFLFLTLQVVTSIVKASFGNAGLFTLSFIVGVTDIDPFILSLVHSNQNVTDILVAAIIISMMGNTLIKGIYFGGLAKEARKDSFLRYGLWTLLHLPFVFA